jgi:choline dehydrogenase-like flavoprotein
LQAEAAQIDAWEQIGNSEWSWESLMPFYKKSEYFQQSSATQILRGASFDPNSHDTSSLLAVGWTEIMMGEEVISSINLGWLGLPLNKEPNIGSIRGLTVFPKTIERADNVREDAGQAYYWPISKRPSLDIYLESFVEEMIWQAESGSQDASRTANGVVFVSRDGTRCTIHANREVILSAGSLRSPLLLEQSGIRNPS